MNTTASIFNSFYRILFSFLIIGTGYAQTTITSTTTGGAWNSTTTWVGGVIPSQASNNNAVIAAGATVTVPVNASCVNLTVNGNLSFSGSGINFSIGNPGSNNGSLTLGAGSTLLIGASNTLEFKATQTGPGITNNGGVISSTGTNGSDGGTIQIDANSGGGFFIGGSAATTVYNLSFIQNATFNISGPGLLINGTFTIPNNNWNWNGASISPTYGPGSTLYIDRGNQGYTQGKEWSANSGTIGTTAGYPNNVVLVNMGSSVFNGTGWHPTGTLGLNGALHIGDGTTNGRITLEDVTNFTCGGIIVDNNSLIIGPKTGATFINKGDFVLTGGTTGIFQNMGATINFAGTGTSLSPQIISTTGSFVQFTNLTISSGTYVQLQDDVTVSGILTLTSGYIGTSAVNSLTVSNTSASAISSGGVTAYVDGPLTWSIPATTSGSYVFPVGDLTNNGGAYLPLTLLPNSTSGANVTTTAYHSNCGGTPDPSVTTLSTTEYWSVSTSSPFTSGPLVNASRPTAVSPFNALAISTTSNGIYSAVGGTPAGNTISGGGIGTGSSVYIVMVTAPLSVVKLSGTNVTCNGTTGSLTVGGSGGTAPYQYSVDGSAFQSSGIFTPLAPGDHLVTVRDATMTTATSTLKVLGSLVINGNDQDVTLCTGSTTLTANNLLNTTPSYSWSDNLSGTPVLGSSASLMVSPSSTQKYYVTSILYNNNLLVNGSFESGATTGFTSSYTNWTGQTQYGTTPGNNGYYSVTSSGSTQCTYFTINNAAGGPTLAAQNGSFYFVGDGAIASSNVWSATVNGLTLGDVYKFNFYYAAGNPDASRAVLHTTINGSTLSGVGDVTTTNAAAWTQATYTWTATSATANISISNLTATGSTNGNDFFLDNMEFLAPCTVTDSIRVVVFCGCTDGTTPTSPQSNRNNFCSNDNGTITLSAGTNTTLQWFRDAAATSSLGSGSVTIPSPIADTTYYVRSAASASGCVSSGLVSVDIHVIIPDVVTADAGVDITPCVTTLTLAGNDPSPYSGKWTLISGDGSFSDDADPSTTISGVSMVSVYAWTIDGTCGLSSSDQIMVSPNTGSNTLVANAGNQDDTLCQDSGKELHVKGSGGSGNYSYHWESDDGDLDKTTQTSSIQVTPDPGVTVYYVEVVDNVNLGCISEKDTITILSTSSQELVIPNLITPNGDEKNDYFEVRDVNHLALLPGANLEVTNRWGESVYRNSSYDNSWNPKSLSDGVYYYSIKSGCGDTEYKGWLQIVR